MYVVSQENDKLREENKELRKDRMLLLVEIHELKDKIQWLQGYIDDINSVDSSDSDRDPTCNYTAEDNWDTLLCAVLDRIGAHFHRSRDGYFFP